MEKEIIDLYELQTIVKEGLEELFPSRLWVKAEIASLRARGGGHCYMELSQSKGGNVVAKVQAIAWASRFGAISSYFRSVTGSDFQVGMNILVRVQINFSQIYGYSLIIDDIDPSFTLGDREQARQQTIARLVQEGLMDLQKELAPPALPRRLAVISAEDAAGYGDFMNHLHGNEYGFAFETTLFPAVMQGASAPSSICAALESIPARDYDMVLILRGGGASLDLVCFDDYGLCAAIAQCPLPVYTAIGHDRDYHVADMVACRYVKTPTALADEIVGWFADEDARLLNFATRLRLAFNSKFAAMENVVNVLEIKIKNIIISKLSEQENRLRMIETRVAAADPRTIVRRGYILAVDGRGVPLKTVEGTSVGDRLGLMFPDGWMDCRVDAVRKGSDMPQPDGSGTPEQN